MSNMNFRIGYGEDIHRLEKGRDLYLAGIKIPHELGLVGHSDADVVIHALSDAILGALAKGDIGMLFPDNDPTTLGMASHIILEKVSSIMNEEGYQIGNIDISILAEKPKLMPYNFAMRESLAKILNIEISQISIKAMTNEKLDSIGHEEAIKAMATVLLERKKDE